MISENKSKSSQVLERKQPDAVLHQVASTCQSAPRRTRTYNPLIKSPSDIDCKTNQDKDLRQTEAAGRTAGRTENPTPPSPLPAAEGSDGLAALASLLAQLAALPPEARQALAAILNPPAKPTGVANGMRGADPLTEERGEGGALFNDRLPWESA
jgi:hypothetical protein